MKNCGNLMMRRKRRVKEYANGAISPRLSFTTYAHPVTKQEQSRNKQGSPVPSDRGNPDQLTKEKEMIENTFKVSGTLKAFTDRNVKTNEFGTSTVKVWLTQRDVPRMSNGDAVGNPRYIVGVEIKAVEPKIVQQLIELDAARQGAKESKPVTVTGRLIQWVAKSQNGGEDQFRYQLEVHDVEVNA